MSRQAIHPNKEAFIEGTDNILFKWTALELAVKNEWGGPNSIEKRDWIVDVVVDLFDKKGSKLEEDYIAELLEQIMEDEFETVLEDNSAQFVAKHLLELYKLCIKGDFSMADRLRLEREGHSGTFKLNMCKGEQLESEEESGSEMEED
ncbi:Pre-rRNA-processing protein TSR2 [Smittium culicis]|uniref:Pre-rRNA-processing protein TSR2 n=1 Tax=Smittium culicis TaxID=133412 RepID=A0A1R1XPP8_9FUNG|nr:Pre-rRNA-processing protein TSR2 [Smittium culicis]